MALWRSGRLLWLFCGIFGYLALVLLAVCISSALYLLAELAEEYPTQAGSILKNMLLPLVCGLHLLLWIDGLPFLETFLGLASHGVYYLMLKHYPLLKLNSYEAPLALFMFCLSHYFWFIFFTDPMNYDLPGRDLLHLVGFFVVLVWAVPFALFVSLTISDNVLPGSSTASGVGSRDHLNRRDEGAGFVQAAKGKGANAFKTVYDFFQHLVETIANYSYTGAGKSKRYKNPGGGTGTGAFGGSAGSGNYLSESGNGLSNSNSLFSTGDEASNNHNYQGQPGQSAYPFVQPNPGYTPSQFTTNRQQSQNTGTFAPQPYPTSNKKAE